MRTLATLILASSSWLRAATAESHQTTTRTSVENGRSLQGTSGMTNVRQMLLSLNQETYISGENIIVSIPATIPGVSRLDCLALFDADVQDLTSTDPLKQVSLLTSTNEARSRINFDNTGRFKFALLTANATTVLGESADFDIVPRTPEQLVLDKMSYVTGESINITIPRASDAQIGDDVKFYLTSDDGTTDEMVLVRQVDLIDVMTTGEATVRLDFVQSGRLKILLCVDGTQIVLGQSMEFEVSVAMDSELVLDKAVYEPGETATISFPVGASFIKATDELRVYPVNETDFTTAPVSSRPVTLIMGDETIYRINFDQVGIYKIVLLINGTAVSIGESGAFEVVSTGPQQLTLTRTSFTQGDIVNVLIPGSSLLRPSDDLRLYPANQTDFSVPPLWEDTFIGIGRDVTYRVIEDPGMYKFVLFLDGSTVVLGETSVFNVTSIESQQLTLNGNAFAPGGSITITIPNFSSIQSIDALRLYPANETDFSVAPARILFLGFSGDITYRVDVGDVGMFRFVLLIDGSTIVAGESPVLELLPATPEQLILDRDSFAIGERITIPIPVSPSIQSTDDLRLFPANQTNFTSPPALWTDSFIGSSGTTSYRASVQNAGMYKFVLFVDRSTAVLGQSPAFAITPATSVQLSLNRNSFAPGETITITIPNSPSFEADDDLRLFPATETNFSTPALFFDFFIGSDREETYRVAVGAGMYKFVMFVDGTFAANGESPAFEVTDATVQITLDRSTVAQGESITVTVPTRSSFVDTADDLRLYPANQTNFSTPSLFLDSFIGSGVITYRANQEAGMYKFVLFVSSTDGAIGESPAFEITTPSSPVQLTLDNNSYAQGETVTISIPVASPSIEASDDLRLYPANQTDFSVPALFLDSIIGSSGAVTYRAAQEPGMYKFVLFVDSSFLALGESPAFEITAPSMPEQLTLDSNSYTQRETVTISIPINSPSIQSSDDLRLYPVNQTDFSVPALYEDTFVGSSGLVFYRVTQEVGMYKFVLFVSFSNIVLAESEPFEVTPVVTQSLTLDQLSYAQGDTIMVGLSNVDGISSFDNLGIYRANTTDFETSVPLLRLRISGNGGSGRLLLEETGMFKVVLLVSGTSIVIGESGPFEITPVAAPGLLLLDGTMFFRGQTITITTPFSLSFDEDDDTRLYPANTTDYSAVPSLWFDSFIGTDREEEYRVAVEGGMYKFALFIDGTFIPIAESRPFEVIGGLRELTLDGNSFTQGNTISITIPRPPMIDSSDDLRLYPVNQTDFSVSALWIDSFVGSSGSVSYTVTVDPGMYRFVLFISGSNTAIGESTPFEVTPVVAQPLTLDKSSYSQGETITLDATSIVDASRFDDLGIYPANTTNFRTTLPLVRLSLPFGFGTSRFTATFRAGDDFSLIGSLMFALLADGTSTVRGKSEVFEVTAADEQLMLSGDVFGPGDTITVTIPISSSAIDSSDDLRLYPEDVTEFSIISSVWSDTFIGSRGVISYRVQVPQLGRYRFVLFVTNSFNVLGESPGFEVVAPTSGQTLTLNGNSFAPGETITITAPSIPEIDSDDDLRLFPANTIDFTRPSLWFDSFIGSDREETYRVAVSEPGMYIFVLFVDGTSIAIGESAPFEITLGSPEQLLLDGTVFSPADVITITIPIQQSSFIDASDDLRLYPAGQIDFSTSAIWVDSFIGTFGTVTYRVNANPGMYQFFLFVSDTDALIGESPTFEIMAPPSQNLTLDKTNYTQGETIVIDFSSVVGADRLDDLSIFNANTIDFSFPLRRLSLPFGFGISVFTVSIRTGEDFDGIGSYVIALLSDGTTTVLGKTMPFEILPPVPQRLVLNGDTFSQRDTIVITVPVSSPAIEISDDLELFPADVFDISLTFPEWRDTFIGSRGVVSYDVNVDELGLYKFVVTIDGTNIIVAESDDFEIVSPPIQELILNNTVFSLGEGVSITNPGGAFFQSSDELRLYPATETDFNVIPIWRLRRVGFTSRVSYRVNVPNAGMYRFVLFNSNAVVAQSPSFEIVKPTQQDFITLDKLIFLTGETAVVNVSGVAIPSDTLSIYPALVTNYAFAPVLDVRNRLELTTARMDFNRTGMFKFVLFLDDSSLVLGESSSFEIQGVAPLTLNRAFFSVWDTVTISIPDTIITERSDVLRLYAADETDLSVRPVWSRTFFGFETEVSTTIDFPVEMGMYKFVLLPDGGSSDDIPIAESAAFEIEDLIPEELILDRTEYTQGDRIVVTIPRNRNTARTDTLKLYQADETDFFALPIWSSDISRFSSRTVSVEIDFDNVGMFQLVLVIADTATVVAQSLPFQID